MANITIDRKELYELIEKGIAKAYKDKSDSRKFELNFCQNMADYIIKEVDFYTAFGKDE